MRISIRPFALSVALLLIPAGAMADHRLPDERPVTSFADFVDRLHAHVEPWIDDPMLELRQPHGNFLAWSLADELGYVVPQGCYLGSYGAYWGLVPTLFAVGQATDLATLDLERGRFREELTRVIQLTEDDAERCASRAETADAAETEERATTAADANVVLHATPALQFVDELGERVEAIRVIPGETILIRVDNTAGFEHTFFIGTEEELSLPMATTDVGIDTWTSGTRELTWAVPDDPSGLLFGCTVPGHFPIMHGRFVVEFEG